MLCGCFYNNNAFILFPSPRRTLTELLKQPGEAGALDGGGVHHPIGTNGISARALRSNTGPGLRSGLARVVSLLLLGSACVVQASCAPGPSLGLGLLWDFAVIPPRLSPSSCCLRVRALSPAGTRRTACVAHVGAATSC
uniref:Uncharacterized protein n=1 Tax=Knipowitschia caucasica TaxID=637954 RepID=A0AAV2KN46_KNICA